MNVYVSEWGIYPIPQNLNLELFDARPQSLFSKLFRTPHQKILDVKPLPANKAFWSWLHEQEVKDGKPA